MPAASSTLLSLFLFLPTLQFFLPSHQSRVDSTYCRCSRALSSAPTPFKEPNSTCYAPRAVCTQPCFETSICLHPTPNMATFRFFFFFVCVCVRLSPTHLLRAICVIPNSTRDCASEGIHTSSSGVSCDITDTRQNSIQ